MAFWLRDVERSAFGLGWEYRRRSLMRSSCPFPPDSRQAEQFSRGWSAFLPSKTAEYANQEIDSPEAGNVSRRRVV